MEVQQAIRERFSDRSFSPRPIEPEKMEKILEAVRCAPSACNYRPERVYVLQSAAALEKANAICKSLYGAPAVLLLCYDREAACRRPWTNDTFGELDATIAGDEIVLAAWEQGIGSCWVGAFDPRQAKEVFALPQSVMPIAMLPMGYAQEGCVPLARLHGVSAPLETMVQYL